MSGDFGNDFVTIVDSDGKEYELEHLDTVEHGGVVYMAFLPADVDEDDEDFGIIILKVIVEDGEEVFSTVDDEAELDVLFDVFVERLMDEEDE